ncbi:hypothetical protein Tco_0421978 [Tanacetum coccineum]
MLGRKFGKVAEQAPQCFIYHFSFSPCGGERFGILAEPVLQGYTMLQVPFSVPWAPYQDPTIEKASVAGISFKSCYRRSCKDGAEQSMEQEAGNEKADQDGGHEKKDGGHGKKDGG